jgi:ABC-type branched-subunit amino acid transport system ATPase component
MSVLELRDINKSFGGIKAVERLSFQVDEGQIMGLIGPNGAGKTTIINLITGFYRPTSGTILFEGKDITFSSIYNAGRIGIARTFQNIRLFKRMTVLENVLIGDKEHNLRPFSSVFDFLKWGKNKQKIERAYAILEEMGLGQHAMKKAGELSYGDQRRLEISRSIATDPKMLLLDEPAAGMNEEETRLLIEDIQRIKGRFKGIIVVEHDLSVIRQLSQKVVAIDYGKKIVEGTPEEVLTHPSVVEAYLGGSHE